MPIPIPDSTPPRPPLLQFNKDRMTPQEIAETFQKLLRFESAFVLWANQTFSQLRDVANWIVQQQGVRNLVPDSDIKDPGTFWTSGGWALLDGIGYGGGRGFFLSASTPGVTEALSTTIVTVTGGDNYVLSGWIDATTVTSGTVSWRIIDATSSTLIAEAQQLNGQYSRVQMPVVIPSTTVLVKVVLRAVDIVLSGGSLVGSQPQLELPHSGVGDATTPQATLYRQNIGAH